MVAHILGAPLIFGLLIHAFLGVVVFPIAYSVVFFPICLALPSSRAWSLRSVSSYLLSLWLCPWREAASGALTNIGGIKAVVAAFIGQHGLWRPAWRRLEVERD
jgi:hypothetical protein